MKNQQEIILYYTKDGKPIRDAVTFAKLFEDNNYRFLIQENTPDKDYLISTVWVGIDNSHFIDGVNPHPLIFETMVFSSKHSEAGCDQQNYSSEGEALKGHKELLKKYTDIEQMHQKLNPDK